MVLVLVFRFLVGRICVEGEMGERRNEGRRGLKYPQYGARRQQYHQLCTTKFARAFNSTTFLAST